MRSNIEISQSISVPVSCVANTAVIDANESCFNANSSLNPYCRPFDSKARCAYNTFASDSRNLRYRRESPLSAVG